jgi:hypothetical protein
VTRDTDLIKDLLLKVEKDNRLDGNSWVTYDRSDDFGGHSLKEVTGSRALKRF